MKNISCDNEAVLVVDDEESVSEPIVGMLRHLGFQAESVNNGYDALKALEKERYTFLLTDIQMPGMNGLELIKRTRDEYPQVSTIAMTGYIKDHSYVDVIGLGACDFIKKPFSIKNLEAKIRYAIFDRNFNQKARQQSLTDSLTGLYNQEHFFNRLRPEVMRAERQNRPLGLILLELDDFKLDNGARGNLEEDKLMQKVGRIIRTSIREGVDSGYRYGAIEFASILTDSDPDIADTILKRIKTSIVKECKLSVCTGYAQYSNGLSPRAFFMKVDDRLSMAKNKKTDNKE